MLVAILASSAFAWTHQELIGTLSTTPQWQGVERDAREVLHNVVSVVAEEPAFAPAAEADSYPICAGVGSGDTSRMIDAMNLMRGTAEGERLFDQLVDQDICVNTERLTYNSGYASGRQSPSDGSWSSSFIMVDQDMLRSGETDANAALLVHEATHIDRYIHGLACNYVGTCTRLPNGVDLEEELAAHAAEAQWWVAAYGEDGKRFATGFDYGLNRLARAWEAGADVFEAYVLRIRSDPREGAAIS
jgi:hypothetical protein